LILCTLQKKAAVDGAQGGGTTHVRVLAVAGVRIPDHHKLFADLERESVHLRSSCCLSWRGRPWFSARSELSRAGLDQIITSHHVLYTLPLGPSDPSRCVDQSIKVPSLTSSGIRNQKTRHRVGRGRIANSPKTKKATVWPYVRALPAVPTRLPSLPHSFSSSARKNYRGNPGGREEMGLELRVLRKDDCCCCCC